LAYADGKSLKLLHLDSEYRPTGPAAILVREPRSISEVNWTPDGKQLIYKVWGDGPYIRRIALQSGARPQPISGLSGRLSISQLLADGSALATETTQLEALWRADLSSTPLRIEIATDQGCSSGDPDCSPEGSVRAFITARTGISEIRVANANGTNERPLVKSIPGFTTGWKGDGVPSLVGWSPDGKWIAFTVFPAHGNADLRSYLYVVPSSGGLPRRLAREAVAIIAPTWSRDSKSLYGSQGWSSRDEAHGVESPIVRVDVADGKITRLDGDGLWPQVSLDGTYLYFLGRFRSSLSRMRIGGGREELRWEHRDIGLAPVVGNRYLYLFIDETNTIVRFDPESKAATTLAELPFRPRFAYLSRDERFLYFGQQDDPKSRVVIVRGLF
jgi:Tol biopolymer transport system component